MKHFCISHGVAETCIFTIISYKLRFTSYINLDCSKLPELSGNWLLLVCFFCLFVCLFLELHYMYKYFSFSHFSVKRASVTTYLYVLNLTLQVTVALCSIFYSSLLLIYDNSGGKNITSLVWLQVHTSLNISLH